ncbi:MAG: L-histidine N(alpha)-methyltransferase [Alphaproteobacteria bacterium]|nr:L-histidine N(alpha)-methyltransferase [Alphaproteobacteria bacterium]
MLGAEDHSSDNQFLKDVIEGLSQKQKSLSPKYFYDATGSALFDKICTLDEYYPTRTEVGLLSDKAGEIAELVDGQHLIEFGSGSSVKIRILLNAAKGLASYVPVDISREHLFGAAESIAEDYPNLDVIPVCADFTRSFDLPDVVDQGAKAGFFPGSTIGNFSKTEAHDFLAMAAGMLGDGGGLVIGVDLKKDPKMLQAAYNDQRGVTAEFNLNLLARINRELGGTFDLDNFIHDARYVEDKGRVEMHLVSLKEQVISINGTPFAFQKDESIHTENSHKYDIDEFHDIGRETGFEPDRTWTDKNNLFSVHYLKVAA